MDPSKLELRMSSSSTIVIKNPAPNFPDTTLKSLNEQKSPSLLIVSLWLFSSIFLAAKTDFSSNTTGELI